MSAFYSFIHSDRVSLLSDTGIFDPDGIMVATTTKVTRPHGLPVALIGRGAFVHVRSLHLQLGSFENKPQRVDDWLAGVRSYLRWRAETGWSAEAEMLIACWSESLGPCHFFFSLHGRYPEHPAFELIRMPAQFGAGPSIDLNDLPPDARSAAGDDDFPDRFGATVLEAMRRPASIPGQSKEYVGVGGSAELTTITAAGTSTRTLKAWPDMIGEKVRPQ